MSSLEDSQHRKDDQKFNNDQLLARAAKVIGVDPENTSWFEVVGELEKLVQQKPCATLERRGGGQAVVARWDADQLKEGGLVNVFLRPAQLPQKYDDTLLPFLELMRKELHANADKGDRPGWLQVSADTLLLEVIYHYGKLLVSVRRGDGDGIAEYAADVANLCMMLCDMCGVIDLSKR